MRFPAQPTKTELDSVITHIIRANVHEYKAHRLLRHIEHLYQLIDSVPALYRMPSYSSTKKCSKKKQWFDVELAQWCAVLHDVGKVLPIQGDPFEHNPRNSYSAMNQRQASWKFVRHYYPRCFGQKKEALKDAILHHAGKVYPQTPTGVWFRLADKHASLTIEHMSFRKRHNVTQTQRKALQESLDEKLRLGYDALSYAQEFFAQHEYRYDFLPHQQAFSRASRYITRLE
jgi:hypothetical protein